MKAIIVGAGISGLMSAVLLSEKGVKVRIYDKNIEVGGVTALLKKNGYAWEQGPLLMGEFLPGEAGYEELKKRGIELETIRGDRGIVMPDYEVWKPEDYRGPDWRRERLQELFPDEKEGIDSYYRLYGAMAELTLPGISKLRKFFLYLKVKKYANWSAQQLMDHFFRSERIKTLFTAILADFCASPKEFPALGVPLLNLETAFDERIPLHEKGKKVRKGYCYFVGGVARLAEALADKVRENGGEIILGKTVEKILIQDNRVRGVLVDGKEDLADIIVASGGAHEVFYGLVGKEHLDEEFLKILAEHRAMESVFMVHLGVDINPLEYQKAALCYYYKTYDLEGAISRLRNGIYHGGADGFLIYVPSYHTPEFAPPGHHALTIYTVAPDTLKEGNWEDLKEEYAEKLIAYAEEYIPGLSKHIKEKVIMTPVEYRRLAHLQKSGFGGLVPRLGVKYPPHRTPIRGLYFVGQQSENAGGVAAVMLGAIDAFRIMEKEFLKDGNL